MKIKNRHFMFMFVLRKSEVYTVQVYDDRTSRLLSEDRFISYQQAHHAFWSELTYFQSLEHKVRAYIFHRGEEILRKRVSVRTETYFVIE